MKNKANKIKAVAIILLLLSTVSITIYLAANETKKISNDKLKVIGRDNAQALLYNPIQESELAILNHNNAVYDENGVLIADQFLSEQTNSLKNDRKTKFKLCKIDSKGIMQSIEKNEIAFTYESLEGEKSDSILIANTNNRPVILQDDPDFCSYNLAKSADGSFGVVWTEKGMQLVSASEKSTQKITESTHLGKTYDELILENEEPKNAHIYWNNDPKISNEGNWIVYTSNRDTFLKRGNEIWIYSILSNNECVLIDNSEGEYYSIIGWYDKDRFIYSRHINGRSTFYISNCS